MQTDIPQRAPNAQAEKRRLILRTIPQGVVQFILFSLFVFIPAGRLDWLMAWAMLLVFVGGLAVTNLWLAIRHTGLAKERMDIPGSAKRQDWFVVELANFLVIFGTLPLAGLNRRFGWAPFLPLALQLSALLVFAAAFVLILWAMSANEYFSVLVRIQSDRGHAVAAGGPYRIVRHPGYVAMIAQFLLAPIALGSLWALIPGAAAAGVYILRTALEDRTLQKELPGYAEYARRVPYLLIPGVW